MRSNGLQARWRRKFAHTTDSRHELPVAGNVLALRFRPERPNEAWATDITYIRTRSGRLYLAVVLDLFSRKIVGCHGAEHASRPRLHSLEPGHRQPHRLLTTPFKAAPYTAPDLLFLPKHGNYW